MAQTEKMLCPATGVHGTEVPPGEEPEPDWDKPCGTQMVEAVQQSETRVFIGDEGSREEVAGTGYMSPVWFCPFCHHTEFKT